MTKRAAIYARYSTDLQSDASIEDQVRVCEAEAERNGWRVVERYSDHGLSGASMMRPGVQMLMQDAAAGKFDVVLAEALDRLSRDQEDIAGIYKRLQFAGVAIVTRSEGVIDNLHIGLKGTMNAIFLKDLADKTRRGLSGRVQKGKSGGGLTYGYDVVKAVDAVGEPICGEREINDAEARIVRRIFEEYAAGDSPKAIAVRLNKEGVPGPSGKGWGPSTIYGNRRRGTGLINNELYIGRLVWNRLRYIKDPETGKRVSRLNPESEWIITDVPELRIVDDELWERVKARQKDLDETRPALWQKRRPKNLFSYLIKCGECGGGCSMVSQTHLGCSNARNKGTCRNRLTVAREKLERALLGTLTGKLMDEALCSEFCDEYTRVINKLRMEHNASLHGYEAELARLERERQHLVQSIKDGVPGSVLKDDAIRIDRRTTELKALMENFEEAPPLFHPSMAQRYHREVRRLIEALNEEDGRAEAAELLRGLVDRIELTPDRARTKLTIDLVGDLAGILSLASDRDKPLIVNDLSPMQEKMVAGAGFEPATFRL